MAFEPMIFVDDVEAGHVVFLGSIREADTPAMLALHLRIRDGKITAVEMLVQRNEKSALGFEELGYTWREIASQFEMDHTAIRRAYFREIEVMLKSLSQPGDFPRCD